MKKTYLESLRIIAVIWVIYNHTRELGFTLYQYPSDTLSHYLSIIMIPICKTAVPVFLMISGAVLLGKTEDYRQLFKKRIARYAGIILFWGTLQYLRYVRAGKAEFQGGGVVVQYLQRPKA
ncbi:MAG: acyltransferase [Bacteroidales bacterium]|nr:acyltransferase [Bacteroidales bacterium]MCM1415076.1 acyltransferase [bacterium]